MTFLRNIGADLVEKRLWPVALGLLVALVAVPVLLSSSPKDEPAGNEPSAAVASAALNTPKAVTLDTKAIGRRVRGGSSKNPFKQLFVPKVKVATTAPATTKADTTPKSATPSPTNNNTGSTPNSPSTPKTQLSVYRATLRFGQPGDMNEISDIPRLTPLPSIENPFFVFLGVKEDGETLVFLVSSDAKATGDATCVPKDTCETIEMKAGDTEMFDVTDDSGATQQYQMDVVKVSKVKATSAKAARAARARHSKAGAALLTIAREDASAPDTLGLYRWDPKRGVLDFIKPKAKASSAKASAVAVGPVAGTASVTP
jgi:hypothetical protein